MAVQDRDWYRDELNRREGRRSHGRGPFPRSKPARSRMLINLALIGAVFLLGIQAHSWWKTRELAHRNEPTRLLIRADELAPPPVPNAPSPEVAEAPQSQQMFKCVVNGRIIYEGPVDCRGALPTIPITFGASEIPRGLSPYQQEMLRAADERIVTARATELPARTTERQLPVTECAALESQIQNLDSRARMPLSGYEQDVLRGARASLRSKQAALRC